MKTKDSRASSDPYEYFMGRWSRLVARSFVDWLSPPPGLKWLDVGCGSGALSDAITSDHEPAELTAIDQSESFVTTAQKRLGSLWHVAKSEMHWLSQSKILQSTSLYRGSS